MGWLQKRELRPAVPGEASGQGLEVPSLSGLDGGPGPGVTVWERKPSRGQVMSEALEGAPLPGSEAKWWGG